MQLNPIFRQQVQAPNLDSSSELNAIASSLRNIQGIASDFRSQEQFKDKIIEARNMAQVKHGMDKEMEAIEQENKLIQMKQQDDYNLGLANKKFNYDSKVTKIAQDRADKRQSQLIEAQDNRFAIGERNKVMADQLRNLNQIKVAKQNTQSALAKIKAATAKGEQNRADKLFKDTMTKAQSKGGISMIVDDSIRAIEDQRQFFDFKLDEISSQSLKAKLTEKLTSDTKEMQKYLMASENPESLASYMKDFMLNYGTIEESPFWSQSDDKWIVNTKGK